MVIYEEKEIPGAIITAATSILAPYCRGLTAEKLQSAIAYQPEEKEEELLSRREVATALHVSMPTIDRMLSENELQRVNIRGRVFIRKSDIDRIIRGDNPQGA